MLESSCALPLDFGAIAGPNFPPLFLAAGDLAAIRRLDADEVHALFMNGGSRGSGDDTGNDPVDGDGDDRDDDTPRRAEQPLDDPVFALADVVPIKPLPSYVLPEWIATGETMAAQFAERHRGDMRFVEAFGRWLAWDGRMWRADQTGQAINAAGELARDIGAERPKGRVKIESTGNIKAIEWRSRPLLAGTVDQWDANPRLLNGPDGTVDLERGTLRVHRRTDYCSKATAVSPRGECPVWLKFLREVMAGDQDMVDFLQRVAGYCATGLTSEQCLFFFYGTGQNGKGTFCHTLANVLGDYASAAAIETFTASSFERHPEELAVLRGARLVLASETEQGRAWSEAKIKLLTGGDRIRARFMRQDSFEYDPQCKLIVSGNHKPALRSTNKAMRRRLHLVPFNVQISDAQRDDTLEETLRHEYAGILQWVVDGAARWHIQGLDPPAAVTEATTDYIDDQDTIGAWLDECTSPDPNAWESSADMFRCWELWAQSHGEYIGSSKRLAEQLASRGVMSKSTNKARGFRGRSITPQWKSKINDGALSWPRPPSSGGIP